MSVVTIYECDVCAKREESSRSTGPVMHSEYRDVNGCVYQVCEECANRLLKPLNDRYEAEALQAIQVRETLNHAD
jgi:hypothetical protein